MTACNGCGACCSPVALAFTQDDIRRALPAQIDPANRAWVLNDLTPITRREGIRRTGMNGGITTAVVGHGRSTEAVLTLTFFYECRHYDDASRTCRAYDQRPPMCADYPWYGMPPEPGKFLPPECSFRADIGQPVTIRTGS